MRIFIDAGHGGSDTGAVGNGLVEKNLNLAVSLALQSQLQLTGLQTMLSRHIDQNVTLEQRTEKANKWSADVYLSIHHNGFSDATGRGIETFYSIRKGDSKKVAEVILSALGSKFPMPLRGAKARLNSAGTDWYHVLRESKAPVAVISEVGFVTNINDANILKASDFPRQQAEVLAGALLDFYKRDLEHVEIEKLKGQVSDLTRRVNQIYEAFGSLKE